MKYSIKRTGVLSLLCLLLAICAAAQETYNSSGKRITANKKKEQKTGFDRDRLIFGAGIPGLSFYNGVFSIGLAPTIGYRITDDFSAGVGIGFQYYSFKDYYDFYNSTTGQDERYPLRSIFYYPSVWARYVVFRNFFVHAEAEYDMQHLREYGLDANGFPTVFKTSYNSPALLLGAGIRQPVSERSSLVIMGLYDVIQDKYSPYRGGIDLRIGFNIGF